MALLGMESGGGRVKVAGIGDLGTTLPGLDDVPAFIGRYGAWLIGGAFFLFVLKQVRR